MDIPIQLLSPLAVLPQYATPGSAGMDLVAALPDAMSFEPGEFKLVPCGIAVAIPEGYEGQVRPRSGLAVRHGITVLNAPGTIDSDYRGEVQVLLINHGSTAFVVTRECGSRRWSSPRWLEWNGTVVMRSPKRSGTRAVSDTPEAKALLR